ncbi:hypothetical protein RvY_04884 [Ramazzottius varieornatus]|uniref:Uncharacterized protein n=1 Tax=Ramazzottius varieornatus TaxID=947166 RepID=A0A1D1V318_RAMVA|nr:hypothetical protein RvY_04884 [Ramazzottius varieornatus]
MCCFEFLILLQQMNSKPPIRGHHPRPPLPSYEQALKRRPIIQHLCPAAHPRASITDLVTCARECIYPEHRVDTSFLDNYDQPSRIQVGQDLYAQPVKVRRMLSTASKNPSNLPPKSPPAKLPKNLENVEYLPQETLTEKPLICDSEKRYVKESVPVRRVRWSHANIYAPVEPFCIRPEQPPPKPPRKFPPTSRSFGSSQSLVYFKSDEGYHSKSSSSDCSSLSEISTSNSTTPVKSLVSSSSLHCLAHSSESMSVLHKQPSSSFVRSTWKGNTLVL